jgi:hypothetical protein
VFFGVIVDDLGSQLFADGNWQSGYIEGDILELIELSIVKFSWFSERFLLKRVQDVYVFQRTALRMGKLFCLSFVRQSKVVNRYCAIR